MSQITQELVITAANSEMVIIAELHKALSTCERSPVLTVDGVDIALPASLHKVLKRAAEILSQGKGIAMFGLGSRLDQYKAAEVLGIPVQDLMKLTARGEIEHEDLAEGIFFNLAVLLQYRALSEGFW